MYSLGRCGASPEERSLRGEGIDGILPVGSASYYPQPRHPWRAVLAWQSSALPWGYARPARTLAWARIATNVVNLRESGITAFVPPPLYLPPTNLPRPNTLALVSEIHDLEVLSPLIFYRMSYRIGDRRKIAANYQFILDYHRNCPTFISISCDGGIDGLPWRQRT